MEKLDITNSEMLENYSNFLSPKEAFEKAQQKAQEIANKAKEAAKKAKEKAEELAKKAKEQAKAAGKNIEQTTRDIGKNIETTSKEIARNNELKKVAKQLLLTGNPAIAVPRSSALAAFRMNIFGLSSRLYPAFLSESDLKKYNFDIENAKKAKESWEKIANFWEDKLGGDRKKLQEAISGAWNKPIFRTKKAKARKESTSGFNNYDELSSNVSGYDDAAIAAYISLGLTLVGSIAGMVKSSKNPYASGTPQSESFNADLSSGDNTIPPPDEEELQEKIVAAKKEKSKKTYTVLGISLGVLLIGGISAYFILRKK
jgi:hypothetical protein